MASEADVQRAIVGALIWDGWLVLRINQGARTGFAYQCDHCGHHGDEPTAGYVRFAHWQHLGIDQQDSGISDVIVVRYGKRLVKDQGGMHGAFSCSILAIEVKAPGKKGNVTDKQQAFLDAITEHGGIAIVADCLEDIEPYLERAKVQ